MLEVTLHNLRPKPLAPQRDPGSSPQPAPRPSPSTSKKEEQHPHAIRNLIIPQLFCTFYNLFAPIRKMSKRNLAITTSKMARLRMPWGDL